MVELYVGERLQRFGFVRAGNKIRWNDVCLLHSLVWGEIEDNEHGNPAIGGLVAV